MEMKLDLTDGAFDIVDSRYAGRDNASIDRLSHIETINRELLEALEAFRRAGVGNSTDHAQQFAAAKLADAAIKKAKESV